jgi:monoamine oxidase
LKTLLIEARDRIGGRTYTANLHGHNIEMGGTWIHWSQPHVFHEVRKYGLHNHFKRSAGTTAATLGGPEFVYSHSGGKLHRMSNAEYEERAEKAFAEFFNIDNDNGRTTIDWPHNPRFDSPDAQKLHSMTVADRLDQIRYKLSAEDFDLVAGMCCSIGTSSAQNISLYDVYKWWALSGYSTADFFGATTTFKLACGTTKLAQCILNDYHGDIIFNSPISAIEEFGSKVVVKLRTRQAVTAARVICTIPLNVLHDIRFSPPLSPLKMTASKTGHIAKGAKVHILSRSLPTLFTSGAPPSQFAFGFTESHVGDKTFSVFFFHNGAIKAHTLPTDFSELTNSQLPIDVVPEAFLFHDWENDEFAKGVWCAYPPRFGSKYFEALQKREGKVLFASADWADGWRGFIDGAIEQGTTAARIVIQELKTPAEAPTRSAL